MKKNLLIVLLTLLPMLANAVIKVNGIYYNYDTETKQASVSNPNGNEGIYGPSNNYSGSLVIPETVTIGGEVYNVTRIDADACKLCFNLTSVTIPSSVTSIGQEAFFYCRNLNNIVISKNVKYVGRNAFEETKWYNNQDKGVIYLNHICYKYKGDMPQNSNIVLRNGTLTIADEAFSEAKNLSTITIPNSVTTIGSGAFEYCGLTSVVIPNSVTSINMNAFQYCHKLTSITIGNNVNTIGRGAFYGCNGLTSINIPNSVTNIKSSAFEECYKLKTVNLGNSVTTIGERAFASCEDLTTIIFPNSLKIIDNDAFNFCRSLTSATIPNGVTTIGSGAFAYSDLTSVAIPNSVTKMGGNGGAFANCSKLASVTIGSGLTSLENYSFSGCGSLTSIVIPSNIKTIGERVFQYCGSLTSVIFNNGIEKIGALAFADCANLSSITIPKSLTSIGTRAFENSGIASIVVEEGNPVYDSRDNCNAIIKTFWETLILGCKNSTIPSSVTTIGQNAFKTCKGLVSINIPDNVTYIEMDAFNETGLTSITIPNNIKIIEEGTFYRCKALTTITFGNSIRAIKDMAFEECPALNHIVLYASTPPTFVTSSPYVFSSTNKQTCVLSVPVGSVDAYRNAPVWKEFSNIKEIDPTLINSATKSDSYNATDIYMLNGRRLNSQQKGLNIIKMKDGSVKKVIQQ